MSKYFGTDGIRGLAGSELDAALACRAGLALATVLGRQCPRPVVLIGRDTRFSGQMLEAALSSGLMSGGADVVSLGVVPTPAVAHITLLQKAAAGIVISASHNPYYDNGLKIFGPDGFKLSDAQEAEIEALIDSPPPPATHDKIGLPREFPGGSPAKIYAQYIKSAAGAGLGGMRLLIDCANGAASPTAPLIFPALGASCDFVANTPDGVNINDGCGSTHLPTLCQMVKDGGYDLGIAFDGDADRCLMADEHGREIDGDRIMAAMAVSMKAQGLLRGALVGTVMSNLGLQAYLKAKGIGFVAAQVGDRYVLEEMQRGGHNIGGEQSGHVILLDHATTGDGQMTAAMFLAALRQSGLSASQFVGDIEAFPQVLVNVAVPNHLKAQVARMDSVRQAQKQVEAAFGSEGRILIRPSGTEPKVRVMVEGRDRALVHQMAQMAAQAIEKEVSAL